MATKLTEMPRKGRYPWDEWTNGSAWRIARGDDFQQQVESMRVRLYGKARELGKIVNVQVDREAEAISFQFTDKPAGADPGA